MIVFVDPEVGHLVIDLYHAHECLVCGKKTARTYYHSSESWVHVCYECMIAEMGFEPGSMLRPDGKSVPVTVIEDEKQVVEPRPPARVYTGARAVLSVNGVPLGRTSFFSVDPPTGTPT